MSRSLLALLLLLAPGVSAQDEDVLVLRERRALLDRDRAELEAQVKQLAARLERVKQEVSNLDREIARRERPEGSPPPADLAALGAEARRLGLQGGWDGVAATWRAAPLGEAALRDLRRTGDRLRETAVERREELGEVLAYVRELALPADDLLRVAGPEALDAAGSWREELLRIHAARIVAIHRLLERFAVESGEEGIVPALEVERQQTDARHRRRLQNHLLQIVRDRPADAGR